ncbi:Homogentisate phytyltransferase 1, chloroplastic [Linum perenne]
MESLLLLPSSPQPPSLLQPSGGRSWRNDALVSAFPKGVLKGSTFTPGLKLERCSLLSLQRNGCGKYQQIRAIKESRKKFVVNATSGQPLESEPGGYGSKNTLDSLKKSLDAFYRFSRPHTVIGTALSIVSVSLLSVQKVSDISPLFCTGVLEAVAAALMMNIYIVGLNQLTDIEIDKVNKPYLPLASGEYSVGTGVFIVASFSVMSFWLGWIVKSWPLFWALFVSFVLGTAYSINMHVFGRGALFSRPLIFATAFMSFFSVVIALFKVFWTCIALLEIAYGIAMMVGAASPFVWSKCITVIGHTILSFLLWNRAKSVDLSSKASITSCYMFVWKLFYTEYLLIPLVR